MHIVALTYNFLFGCLIGTNYTNPKDLLRGRYHGYILKAI